MAKLEVRLIAAKDINVPETPEGASFSAIELQQATGSPAYVVLLRLSPTISPTALQAVMQLSNEWLVQLKALLKTNDLMVGIAMPDTTLEVWEVPPVQPKLIVE